MTTRELFEKVKVHLLAQKERSLLANGITCAYRGERGLRCAIGALITDENYSPDLEGVDVQYFHERSYRVWDAANASVGRRIAGHEREMLRRLQGIHDFCPTDAWERQIAQVERDMAVLN